MFAGGQLLVKRERRSKEDRSRGRARPTPERLAALGLREAWGTECEFSDPPVIARASRLPTP